MAFKKVELNNIKPNPFRNMASYVTDKHKVKALAESIGDTSFWENLLARETKEGVIELAFGHHRIEALKMLVAEGYEQYKTIKVNVRPYYQLTDERMLKIFAQENKSDWGENPQNLCMTVLQLQAYLEGLVKASKDKDAFLKKIGDAGALSVDDRSFTRMKNNGVGASTIAQFLGDTWSRQTIQDALQVVENDEATFKLAQQLPSVTLANRFQKLVTKSVDGKGKDKVVTMFDEAIQTKVADAIVKENLTRRDVEEAIKITNADKDSDPILAINTVVEAKKEKLRKIKEDKASTAPAPKDTVTKIQEVLEKALSIVVKDHALLSAEDITRIQEGMALLTDALLNPVQPQEDVDPLSPTEEALNDLLD